MVADDPIRVRHCLAAVKTHPTTVIAIMAHKRCWRQCSYSAVCGAESQTVGDLAGGMRECCVVEHILRGNLDFTKSNNEICHFSLVQNVSNNEIFKKTQEMPDSTIVWLSAKSKSNQDAHSAFFGVSEV